MDIYINVSLRMNMRDWDAFQQLLSEQIKDPEVLDVALDREASNLKPRPKPEPKPVKQRVLAGPRKPRVDVQVAHVRFVKSMLQHNNSEIARRMPTNLPLISTASIGRIRKGNFDHLLEDDDAN